jgi:cytosine/adenosine deaminase-related metal-dependent hydrolase
VAYDPVLSPRDLPGLLVWAGSRRDVTDVWVEGRRVVEAGECLTIDLSRERAALRAAAARLAG